MYYLQQKKSLYKIIRNEYRNHEHTTRKKKIKYLLFKMDQNFVEFCLFNCDFILFQLL
jgi:hypothetical protein